MRTREAFTTVLSLTVVAALSIASPAAAQIDAGSNGFFGLSLFAGPPTGEEFQVITGYDTAPPYTSIGDSVTPTADALVLERDGIYRVHLEGVLFMDSVDPTADVDAAAMFSIVMDGVPWVVCSTESNTGAAPIAAGWRFSPDHDVAASCTVDFTVVVRKDGSDPYAFPFTLPRGTAVQAALIPNGNALGDATQALVRFEISRIVP